MKKILFITSLFITIISNAQPFLGLHGSIDFFTPKPSNDDYSMTIRPYSWGMDVFHFTFQYAENHLTDPSYDFEIIWEDDLHDYPDITSEKIETYKTTGFRSFSLYYTPVIPKLKGFYIGFGAGIVQSYDIQSTVESRNHKYYPQKYTSACYVEVSNRKIIPSLNLNLRYNVLENVNIYDEIMSVYLCPMITISTYTKIKPLFGLAFGLGFNQSRADNASWFTK